MQLDLDRDLIFFDIEATGLNVIRDRIVQIALVKYPKDGSEPSELSQLINPGIPISEEAMRVHGITPRDVANKPTFVQVAQELYDFIGEADLAGYNSNRFDVPMLLEEFDRAGFDFDLSKRRLVDVQRIFYKMEPRTLRAALKFYTGAEMENAHDAMGDVRATIEVFKGQLDYYRDQDHVDEDGNVTPRPLSSGVKAIHDFCNDLRFLDATQRLKLNEDNEVVFAFGKHLGKPAKQVLREEPNYFSWILNKEFSVQVKQILRQLMQEEKHS
jgi:DNA polymerase-3 subunit epsilon